MRRLWLWVRTKEMNGWNPLYSPLLHFDKIIRESDPGGALRQGFLDAITEDLAEKRRRMQ